MARISRTSKERWNIAQKAEKGYWDYWRRSGSEERGEIIKAYWNWYLNFLKDYSDIKEESRILEIGCGADGIIKYVGRSKKYGLDPLMDFYIQNFEMSKEVEWLKGGGEDIPFQNDCFNIVIATNVLDHTMNPKQVLFEINRVLKKQGLLLLTVDTYTPFTRYYRIIRELLGAGDKLHPHSFSVKCISRLIENHGLRLLAIHKGLGDLGAYTSRKLTSNRKLSSHSEKKSTYFERGLQVLRGKGVIALICAVVDNIWFLLRNKFVRIINKIRFSLRNKAKGYNAVEFLFIASK